MTDGDRDGMPEMPANPTPEGLRAWHRDYLRWERDREVAAGRRRARSHREIEIYLNSLRVLDERRQGCAAAIPEDQLPPLPYQIPPGSLLPGAEPIREPSRRRAIRKARRHL